MRSSLFLLMGGLSLGIASADCTSTENDGAGGDAASSTATSVATSPSTSGSGAGGADPCSPFVGSVVDVTYGPGAGFGQDAFPQIVMGPPRGGGDNQGSLDVLSLGDGGVITLAFGDETIVDGPGPDFIVFENPFYAGGNPDAVFAELATVAVSDDGTTWTSFPCTALEAPFGSCAGWHPVEANPGSNHVDPTDPNVAGGDAFDLADIGVTAAKYVRITDRIDQPSMSFDLDAVALVHSTCAAP